MTNDRAYVASYFSGYDSPLSGGNVELFDVSNPETPLQNTAGYIYEDAFTVAVNGDYLYAQHHRLAYLGVYDISDPTAPPARVSRIDDLPYRTHFIVANGFGYLPGLRIFDLTAGTPIETGNVDGASADFIAVNEQYAFVTGEGPEFRGFQLIDISNPFSPCVLSTLNTPYDTRKSVLSGNYAYVAAGRQGLQVVDISDPLNLQLLATADTIGEAHSVFVEDGYVFIGTTYGVEVLQALP